MRKEQEHFANSTIFEGMTSIRAILHASELQNIPWRPIYRILFNMQKQKKLEKDLRYLRAMAEKYHFDVVGVDAETIEEYAIGNTHGGLIAFCGERTLPCLSECEKNNFCRGFYALIDGIEDPYNFGYAIRSLYACGVNGIVLGTRNWMTAAGVVCRASAGASEQLPMYISEAEDAIDFFHELQYQVVAADLRTENELGFCPLKYPLLLIAGGEKRGISKSVLDKADTLVKISYARDFHASLSAASAVTMFAYEIMRQNKK